jgi:4'-phosphopantetheinyl transferase
MPQPSPPIEIRALDSGSLHIWLTQLTPYKANEAYRVNKIAAQLMANLSTAELNRANTFSRPEARHRYLQVRSEVRTCLARYARMHPRELNLEPDAQGKPLLTNVPTISFNLSHSGEYLALAISSGADVGIDLEQISERRSWHAIAQRYFHQDELTQLMALPETERHQAFYRWWTLKEAFFKARGTGIATGLDKAVFDLRGAKISYRFAPDLAENTDNWQFQQGQWQHNYSLALACRAPCAQPLKLYFYQGRLTDDQILEAASLALAVPMMSSSA